MQAEHVLERVPQIWRYLPLRPHSVTSLAASHHSVSIQLSILPVVRLLACDEVELRRGGTPRNIGWGDDCGPLSESLTLFMTKIFGIPYPIYDLTITSFVKRFC